jgi:hypothetical protein
MGQCPRERPHESLLLQRGSRGKGAAAPFPCTPNPRSTQAFASLRTFSVDDAEHFLHNHHASVASLRLLFTFAPKFTTSTLASGAHTITATYNGSTSFISSSASLIQTVN